MLNKDCGFGTKAIHAGNVKDTQYGALTNTIFQTSNIVFDSCAQGLSLIHISEPTRQAANS